MPAHRQSFALECQRSTQEAQKQAEVTLQTSAEYYNTHAHNLTDIHVSSSIATQNAQSKLWDTYRVVAEHRRYYIKTQAGGILVWNHRFLRHRVSTSIIMATQQTETVQHDPSKD